VVSEARLQQALTWLREAFAWFLHPGQCGRRLQRPQRIALHVGFRAA